MKIYKKQFSLKDLLEVANDSRMRVGATPFGAPPDEVTIYAGRSVPWKGVIGIENVRAINPGVAAGLSNAIRVSQAHHEKGSAWVQFPNGAIEAMPLKCYYEMATSPHGTMIRLISTLASKRPWIISKPRRRAVMPTPALVPGTVR